MTDAALTDPAPAPVGRDEAAPLLFLSHAGIDTATAKSLKSALLAAPAAREAGLKVWLDVDDLSAGSPWKDQIEAALAASTAFAVIVGPNGVQNWVKAETDIALSRATKDSDYPFLPVLFGGARSGDMTPFARRFHAVRDPLEDTAQLQALLAAALGGGVAGRPALTDAPFPGLQSMSEAWSDRFFGRAREVTEIIERFRENPCLAIVADSGAGKSSLAMAGVGAAWHGGAFASRHSDPDAPEVWNVITMRPQAHPIEELRRAVSESAQKMGLDPARLASLRAQIDVSPSEALYALECDLPAGRTRTLLIIDQGEELVTETTDEAEREAFARLIADMVRIGAAHGRLRVLITMRADYANLVTQIDGLRDLIRDAESEVRIKALRGDDLARIVTEPLAMTDYPDQDEVARLAERVVGDLSDRPGDLALAQSALALTWRDRDKHGGLIPAYHALGGVLGALGQEADRVARHDLTDAERALLSPVFIRLVRLGETAGATRRTAELAEFTEPQRRLIDKLASASYGALVQVSEKTVEISHEALIRQWGLLHSEVVREAPRIRVLGELMERTSVWWEGKRRISKLAPRVDLEDFQRLRSERPDWISRTEMRFLRQSSWFLRLTQGFVAVTVVGLIGLGWYSYVAQREATRQAQLTAEAAEAELAQRQRAEVALAQAEIARTEATQQAEMAAAAAQAEVEQRRRAEEALSRAEEAQSLAETAEAAALAAQTVAEAAERSAQAALAEAELSQKTALILLAETKVEASPIDAIQLALSVVGELDGKLDPRFAPAAYRTMGKAIGAARISTIFFPGQDVAQSSVAISPDGQFVVTGDQVGLIRIWDARTGELLQFYEGHRDEIWSVEFSATGEEIISASYDGTVRIWDLYTAQELRRFEGQGDQIYSAALSPDGRSALSAGSDGSVWLWDVLSGRRISVLLEPSFDPINRVGFSQSGDRAFAASTNGKVRIWDVATGEVFATLEGHIGPVYGAGFSPDGTLFVTGGDDRVGQIWNLETGEAELLLWGHEAEIWSASFSADGKRIITASSDRSIRLWDVETGLIQRVLTGHSGSVMDAKFAADGLSVVSVGFGAALVWDIESGGEILQIQGHDSWLNSAELSPDSRLLLTGSEDQTARLWNPQTGAEIGVFEGHSDAVRGVSFSPDTLMVATASADGTARIWDRRTGQVLHVLEGHEDWVNTAVFSQDGSLLLTSSDDFTGRIWDAETGEEVSVLLGHDGLVHYASFSPDGSRIVTASDDGTALVWETASSTVLFSIEGHQGYLTSASFSPDGRMILTSASDNFAALWDAATGELIRGFPGHSDIVTHASFSADGRRIVTTSEDRTARVWDTETGVEIHALEGHQATVLTANFSADGRRIATSSVDGTARIWGAPLASGNLFQSACEALPYADGAPFTAVTGLAAEIGFSGLAPLMDCASYGKVLEITSE